LKSAGTETRKKRGGVSTGLSHFYRQLLEDEEQKHQETVAATEKRMIGPQAGPNLTILKPHDVAPLADLDLARLARAEGKEVELNDDGQIVDKRELLSAGLNLSLPNTRQLGKQNPATGQALPSQVVQAHRAVGTAASRREINERRAREIEEQMATEQSRVEQQKQLEAEKATQRAIAKRNNENDVESARARYLERKRRRLEDAQDWQDPSS
jgi:coiled-coil domain-containing protein 55